MTPAAGLRSFSFEVHGHVQGVFFRAHTQDKARQLKLVGWVANTARGTVTGVAQGPPAALAEMRAFLERGSPASSVGRVDVGAERALPGGPEFKDFDVVRGRKP